MQGEGPLLIILPGNTAASAAHTHEINYFSDRYRAVSIDFLGTGSSDRIVSEWPITWWEDGGDQVAALIDHLGYENAVLFGVSGGAITAVAAAINHPASVRAVIGDSFSLYFTEEMYRNNVLRPRNEISEQQQLFWEAMHGSDWQDVIVSDTAMIGKVVEQGGSCITGDLEAVSCPCLFTLAEEDNFLPDVKQTINELDRKIPNCRIELFEKGDHPLVWTNPVQFFPVVDTFLSSLNRMSR